MLKLYGININEEAWDIEKVDNDDYLETEVYQLYDKKTGDKYTFNNVYGINEVGDHDFLIYTFCPKKVMRVKLDNSRKKTIFEYNCESEDCVVLTDDRIMLTYTDRSAKTRGEDIYSISENKMIEDFDWLRGKALTVYKDENNREIMYVEDTPSSNSHDYFLSFAVDPNTLEPISSCYSYLRDQFIRIDNKNDYFELVNEERKYISIVESIRMQDKIDSKKKAKEKIIK